MDERARVFLDVELTTLEPRIDVHREPEMLVLDATVRVDLLCPACAHVPLVLGLSAVVESIDGALSYWALMHPAAKPDFHHPDALVLELDEIRN